MSDGLLVGEHANRPDFPPTLFAAEVLAAGGRPWTTLACRDRNRVVLEQELAGLAALGVDGVLCVTGDARGPGVRPDVTQVFDLDGTRLAALAAAPALPAAVPESPDAPPVGLRPARVARQAAGRRRALRAQPRGPPGAGGRVRRGGPGRRCDPAVRRRVAVYTDERSARVLQRFPGLHLDAAAVERGAGRARPARGRASPPPSTRRGRCSRCRASSASTCPGLGSGRGEDDGAQVKAEVAAG